MGDSGINKIFRVYGKPLCDQSLYTEDNLIICTAWAADCNAVNTTDDADNIPKQVQAGARAWFVKHGNGPANTGVPTDPFTTIPADGGECDTYASLMKEGLNFLGVTAGLEYIGGFEMIYPPIPQVPYEHWRMFYTGSGIPFWLAINGDADSDKRLNYLETGYPGTLEGIYRDGSLETAAWRSTQRATAWNFHGACSCAGHWWEITFNSPPIHDTEANMNSMGGRVMTYWGWWQGGSP